MLLFASDRSSLLSHPSALWERSPGCAHSPPRHGFQFQGDNPMSLSLSLSLLSHPSALWELSRRCAHSPTASPRRTQDTALLKRLELHLPFVKGRPDDSWVRRRRSLPHPTAMNKLRIVTLGLARGGRKWSLNDGQIPTGGVGVSTRPAGYPGCQAAPLTEWNQGTWLCGRCVDGRNQNSTGLVWRWDPPRSLSSLPLSPSRSALSGPPRPLAYTGAQAAPERGPATALHLLVRQRVRVRRGALAGARRGAAGSGYQRRRRRRRCGENECDEQIVRGGRRAPRAAALHLDRAARPGFALTPTRKANTRSVWL